MDERANPPEASDEACQSSEKVGSVPVQGEDAAQEEGIAVSGGDGTIESGWRGNLLAIALRRRLTSTCGGFSFADLQ